MDPKPDGQAEDGLSDPGLLHVPGEQHPGGGTGHPGEDHDDAVSADNPIRITSDLLLEGLEGRRLAGSTPGRVVGQVLRGAGASPGDEKVVFVRDEVELDLGGTASWRLDSELRGH